MTRKYPPRIGGMESLSWELTTRIAQRRPTHVLALRQGTFWLPLFLGRCALSILTWGALGRIAILHLGDPVLAPLGRLAKLFAIPVCVTVHGLDIAYSHPLYRLWLRIFLRDFDAYICISNATRDMAIARHVPASHASVIGIGVTPPIAATVTRETDLLLFVGRLVRRKGLEWFVREALPRLAIRRPAVRLKVIGAGPERASIEKAAVAAGVVDRIEWLGVLSDAEKLGWLQRAAVCIVPNVRVAGDIEGYGLVALEAAATGCAVVAADLEGLRDAIVDGKGGRLVAAEDADSWTAAIARLLDDPANAAALGAHARAWVCAERNWEQICDHYEILFDSLVLGTATADSR